MRYANNTVQYYTESWWITDNHRDFRTGRLVKAILLHVHLVPFTLVPIGRTDDPTNHSKARYSMRELKLQDRRSLSTLPAAGLTFPGDDAILAYRGKKRPALIISSGGGEIPRELREGKPRWQTDPVITVVPYYGADKKGTRAGFHKKFIERVMQAEYPNFYWDKLPTPDSESGGSICRLDHLLPLGKHHDSVEFTKYCLSNEAIGLIHEWVRWLVEGVMDPNGLLKLIREELNKIEKI